MLERLARDTNDEVRAMIAEHPGATPMQRLRLSADKSRSVIYAIARAPLGDRVLALLRTHPHYVDMAGRPALHGTWKYTGRSMRSLPLDAWTAEVRADGIYSHPAWPSETLPQHISVQNGSGGYAMALHPWIGMALREELAHAEYAYTRSRIAGLPETPFEMVENLSRDSLALVRQGAASNAALSTESWERLATEPIADVRSAAAAGPSASESGLLRLAADSEKWVRRGVLMNAVAPPALLERLAADAEPEVRKWVALAERVPREVIHCLTADDEPAVRSWAVWRESIDALVAEGIA